MQLIQGLIQGSGFRQLLVGILLVSVSFALPVDAAEFDVADRIIVKKSERKILLMKNNRVLKAADIALGLLPDGHKIEEGDFRTPEGTYVIDKRNPNSDFFLSIRISYPNNSDQSMARARGVSPGGQIMIHGLPNNPRHSDEYYQMTDWTDGCIAVSNSDMVDIWLMTRANTPIQILP